MPKVVQEVLTVLSHRIGSVDQSGGQRGDYEPFALELGRPLGRRHERGAFRYTISGQAHGPLLVDRLHVGTSRVDHNDFLGRAGTEEREKGGDTVDHSKRIDLKLWEGTRCKLRPKEEWVRVHVPR